MQRNHIQIKDSRRCLLTTLQRLIVQNLCDPSHSRISREKEKS